MVITITSKLDTTEAKIFTESFICNTPTIHTAQLPEDYFHQLEYLIKHINEHFISFSLSDFSSLYILE